MEIAKWKFIIFFLNFLISTFSFSQQQFLPLNRENNLWLERHLNNKENFSHTAFKPYLESKINYDSLEIADSTHRKNKEYKKWLGRKLKSESLIVVDSGELYLTIDPLFTFQYGKDFANDSAQNPLYTNTRGILVRADIGKKISVQSSFLENQSFFPQYIDDFVKTYGVVPGNGRVKIFKKTGYDYAMASGYVSFSPLKNLNFQFGHDKNFIGDGYRSLFLSDNAFNYPFLKITSSIWKNRIQYTNLYTQLSTLKRIPAATTPEALFIPKAGTFHYLSFIPWKRLHIGFFEGTIWQRWDSTGTMPFDWNFVNPVIFANTAIYGLNGKNNSLIGANLKLKILKGLALYSQFVYDDKNKYGYQIGLKSFDLFSVKNLNLQMEYNTHSEDHLRGTFYYVPTLQDFRHYNQPLAHPFKDGFDEIVFFLDYKWRDFIVQEKSIKAIGYNFDLYPGVFYNIDIDDFKFGYIINHKTNMNIYFGFLNRRQNNLTSYKTTQFLYFGIRTSLSNQYLDF